ncbi:MAG: YceI family protein [Bacteroidetes bacterium]|nr:YceI family protein [Bacteroidota bacterium]
MRNLLAFFITIFTLSYGFNLSAQSGFSYTGHEMTISGTSSVHDWVSEVTEMKAKGSMTVENGAITAISGLEVTIPVESIESPKGSIMDGKTYDALKSDDYPNITFKLTAINFISAYNGGYSISARGKLTMAGETRSITIQAFATKNSDGSYTFKGSKDLKMTDYNIDPPTAMLGALKTADEITIDFKVTLK